MKLGSSNEIILWLGVTRTVLKAGSTRKVENHWNPGKLKGRIHCTPEETGGKAHSSLYPCSRLVQVPPLAWPPTSLRSYKVQAPSKLLSLQKGGL